MLRIHFLQQWFGLSDPAMEEALHDLRSGSVVDAPLISAPSSTKNRTGERDPEMRQAKKGNNWYFGMKAHIGADASWKPSFRRRSAKNLTLTANPRLLARFDNKAQQWRIDGGSYEIALARSAGAPVLTAQTQMGSRLFAN